MHNVIPASELAAAILAGTLPASAAMGRADAYDHLNASASGGILPMLGTSAKIDAGMSVGVLSTVLYMMPGMASGREACPGRSAGCTAACLAEGTGRMSMSAAQTARRRRHASFFADRGRFLRQLHAEVARHERKATRAGKIAAVRLNGTTDLPWHRMPYTLADGTRIARIHDAFPAVRFYEYTKRSLVSMRPSSIPANLALTFSVSERADADDLAAHYLRAGHGAAVVLAMPKHAAPATFTIGDVSYPTVDGDAHDARFLDPAGSIVALAAKGFAKADASGFVRPL